MIRFILILMFGVDKEGNDTLTPQFSHGKKVRTMKPGSANDLQMRISIEELRLNKSDYAKNKALAFALRDLYDSKLLQIPPEYFTFARNKVIDDKIEKRKAEIDKENYNSTVMQAQTGFALTSGFLSTIHQREELIAEQIARHDEQKYRKWLEKSINYESDEVINSALMHAYTDGKFKQISDNIDKIIQKNVRKMAEENALSAVQIESVAASRNAILRIAEF